MEPYKSSKHVPRIIQESLNTSYQRMAQLVLLLFGALIPMGCTKFVEVDPPKNTLVAETVFRDPATVESALGNLYYTMREGGMISGINGLTPYLSIYGDELDYYGVNADQAQLFQHDVQPGNAIITEWWSQAYHLIYGANDILKGVAGSDALSMEDTKRLRAQALFVRAYVHSLLESVFGDVPYITSTDYLDNNRVSRAPKEEVQGLIIADLLEAMDDLEGFEPLSPQKVIPDQNAVKALLARHYLYAENWELAASLATELINTFPLEDDLDHVFLKDSQETIWQLKADDDFPLNTREAEKLIIRAIPGQTFALTSDLLLDFEGNDLRRDRWVSSISDMDNTITLYFAHKYKADINETESLEYSILFRSAEQFLIRAEARANMGNIAGAQADLNAIRERAGLPNTNANTKDDLLDAILKERRIELFSEQGLRWFDLKRTGRADQVMPALKPNWKNTDLLFPIPESELEANPNLLPQNDGY